PEHQQLHAAEILDPLQAHQLLAHQQVPVLPRPAARLHLRAAEKRLWKAAKGEELPQLLRRLEPQLGHRQRVEMKQVISALKRISRIAIEVEPRTAGDEDALPFPAAVIKPLQVVAPQTVLVNLVEDPQRGGRELPLE